MLSSTITDIADAYWVASLGCPPSRLFESEIVVLPHSAFKGYGGFFLVRRGRDSLMVCAPESLMDLAHTLVHERDVEEVSSPGFWRQMLPDFVEKISGPTLISYVDEQTLRGEVLPGTMRLDPQDDGPLGRLRQSCSEEDWDHAGVRFNHPVLFGHYVGGELTAVASVEAWGRRSRRWERLRIRITTGRGMGSRWAWRRRGMRWRRGGSFSFGRWRAIRRQRGGAEPGCGAVCAGAGGGGEHAGSGAGAGGE